MGFATKTCGKIDRKGSPADLMLIAVDRDHVASDKVSRPRIAAFQAPAEAAADLDGNFCIAFDDAFEMVFR